MCASQWLLTRSAGHFTDVFIVVLQVPKIYEVDDEKTIICAMHDRLNDASVTGMQTEVGPPGVMEKLFAGQVRLMAYACNLDVANVIYAIVEKITWKPGNTKRVYTSLTADATHWGFISLDGESLTPLPSSFFPAFPTMTLTVDALTVQLEPGRLLSVPGTEHVDGWDLNLEEPLEEEKTSYVIFLGLRE